jgi:hypothetical protein
VRGQDSPISKALRKQEAEVLSEKKYTLPMNGYVQRTTRVH